jgi:parvulin-like peptidyl-prolyl cis-trans isomerase-like protein
MSRLLFLICIFVVTALPAQSQSAASPQQVSPVAHATSQPPVQPPVQVAPDAPVVTIHGLCPDGKPKSDSCVMVMTRQQFENMVTSINITNQNFTPAAMKNLATTFVTILSLADAGAREGVDKDPRFQELLRVARTRALADAYRRYLQEKSANPSEEEIQAYYKENAAKFEQVKIDRILVPKVNPKRSTEKPGEFEQKARQLATEIRERAARGEDVNSLQAEVYTTLAIQAMPPQTELNDHQKAGILPSAKQHINDLKPGQVTQVEVEPSGFNIYKLRSRGTITLDQARAQIIKEISQKNFDAGLKDATNGVRSDFNEDFFNPRTTGGPPQFRRPIGLNPTGGAPAGGPVARPATPPAATGSSVPPAQTAPPK